MQLREYRYLIDTDSDLSISVAGRSIIATSLVIQGTNDNAFVTVNAYDSNGISLLEGRIRSGSKFYLPESAEYQQIIFRVDGGGTFEQFLITALLGYGRYEDDAITLSTDEPIKIVEPIEVKTDINAPLWTSISPFSSPQQMRGPADRFSYESVQVSTRGLETLNVVKKPEAFNYSELYTEDFDEAAFFAIKTKVDDKVVTIAGDTPWSVGFKLQIMRNGSINNNLVRINSLKISLDYKHINDISHMHGIPTASLWHSFVTENNTSNVEMGGQNNGNYYNTNLIPWIDNDTRGDKFTKLYGSTKYNEGGQDFYLNDDTDSDLTDTYFKLGGGFVQSETGLLLPSVVDNTNRWVADGTSALFYRGDDSDQEDGDWVKEYSIDLSKTPVYMRDGEGITFGNIGTHFETELTVSILCTFEVQGVFTPYNSVKL